MPTSVQVIHNSAKNSPAKPGGPGANTLHTTWEAQGPCKCPQPHLLYGIQDDHKMARPEMRQGVDHRGSRAVLRAHIKSCPRRLRGCSEQRKGSFLGVSDIPSCSACGLHEAIRSPSLPIPITSVEVPLHEGY